MKFRKKNYFAENPPQRFRRSFMIFIRCQRFDQAMALEDAYIFGKLLAKNINNIEVAQSNYQKIRLPRIKFIKQISENQGKLYHLSNPLLIKGRNFLMKLSNKYTDKRIQRIWDYDPDKVI